jgi:hypothetical protein
MGKETDIHENWHHEAVRGPFSTSSQSFCRVDEHTWDYGKGYYDLPRTSNVWNVWNLYLRIIVIRIIKAITFCHSNTMIAYLRHYYLLGGANLKFNSARSLKL